MRSVVLYLVLVGIPLLGLLGILEAGERIAPPRSMGGEWQLLPMAAHEVRLPCFQLGRGDAPTRLIVSQSGTRAELIVRTRPRLRLVAEVRADSLIGEAGSPDVSACPGGVVRIRAELREGEEGRSLRGILSTDDCAECSPVLFLARRLVTTEEP